MAGQAKKVLLLCNSDYGQANSFLATSYALLATGAPIEIHIGSEHRMESTVRATIRHANETLGNGEPHEIHFHGIDGLSQFQAMQRPERGILQAWELPLHLPSPSFTNAAQWMWQADNASWSWEIDEIVERYDQTVRIIEEVDPCLVIIDVLAAVAMTAAHHLKLNWMVLAPNTVKDFAVPMQPYGAALWKYPVLGSALPYPIPWRNIPMNMGLMCILAYACLTGKRRKAVTEALQRHVGDQSLQVLTLAEMGVVSAPPPGLEIMVGFSEDLDYPFKVIPAHLKLCGPIVRPSSKLAHSDPKLNEWLSKGPTVYVNLGSQLEMTADEALEFALAIRDLLDAPGWAAAHGTQRKAQVLWKIKPKDGSSRERRQIQWEGAWAAVRDVFAAEMDEGRVRIESWIEADPCAILQSGHVVCSVHHGGANSHHEALAAGVPQVVVSSWIDCYDFGNRVEMLGTGVRANKMNGPRWERAELGASLKEVILGDRAAAYQDKARQLAARHPEQAGRDAAAAFIVERLAALQNGGGVERKST